MPQYDLYHDTVKNALIKDGWVITDDPFTIEFKGVYLYADLSAEKFGRSIIQNSNTKKR
jgi:hypothetical protein